MGWPPVFFDLEYGLAFVLRTRIYQKNEPPGLACSDGYLSCGATSLQSSSARTRLNRLENVSRSQIIIHEFDLHATLRETK